MSYLDLLRHGEVEGGICLGRHHDLPLNEKGWSQMRSVLKEPLPWQFIVSSPSSRCKAFAEELAGRFRLPLRFEPRFREIGFGDWEGRTWADLYEAEGESLLAFQRNPSKNPAPKGEDYADFEKRVFQAWDELLKTRLPPFPKGEADSAHGLLISHAGTQRAILRKILNFPIDRLFQINLPHACLSRIYHDDSGLPHLVFHGGSL